VAIGVENHPDMRHKDTGHNVRVTEEFTVNIAKDALVDQQNRLHRREADRPRVTQRQFLRRGREEVNPAAEVQLIITGDWSLPVREAESAQALIDTGCDVIACHVDSPKVVIETAESRGVKTLGHNADQSSLAPKGFITGAQMKWSSIYDAYAKLIAKGEKLPNLDEGGYDKDLVLSTPFDAGANGATRKAVQAAIDDMKADKPIFVGGVKDKRQRDFRQDPRSL
jgi:hypothetical protein